MLLSLRLTNQTELFKISLVLLFVFLMNKSFSQQAIRTMLRIPDTGQNTSYTNTFGEDNDYTIYAPAFSAISNGTTIDLQTSLMWQVKDGGEMTITDAEIYCDTLTIGGFTDWRLPNPSESFSILNHQNVNPALNSSIFTLTAAEYWWTSARQANDTTKIWVTNAGGGIGNHPKNETISAGGNKKFHVRAVRNTTLPRNIPLRFIDNSDSVVYDVLTGLYWTKYAAYDSLTWEDALNHSENLSTSLHTDWRLPNIKELQSLNDESLINPSISSSAFPGLGINKFWSSTTLPNQTAQAWYLHTQYGITTYSIKTAKLKVLCVRDSANIKYASVKNIERNNKSWSVYPNPFSNHLQFNNKSNIECRLLNLMGETLYIGKQIELQDFTYVPKGLYLLQLIENGKTIKLIKE